LSWIKGMMKQMRTIWNKEQRLVDRAQARSFVGMAKRFIIDEYLTLVITLRYEVLPWVIT